MGTIIEMNLEERSFDFACGDTINLPAFSYGSKESHKSCSDKCFVGLLFPYGSRGCRYLQSTLNKRSCCRGSNRQCSLECSPDMERFVCCTSRSRGSGFYVSDLQEEANRFLKQDELGLSTFGKVGIAFGTIFIFLVMVLLQRVYCPYRSRFTSNRTSSRSNNEHDSTNRSTSLPSAPNRPPYDDSPPSYESLAKINFAKN